MSLENMWKEGSNDVMNLEGGINSVIGLQNLEEERSNVYESFNLAIMSKMSKKIYYSGIYMKLAWLINFFI